MTKKKIEQGLTRIRETYGPWTAHRIALPGGLTTMPDGPDQSWRVSWFDGLMRRHANDQRSSVAPARGWLDRLRLKLSRNDAFYVGRRLLDLACLEGLFAIEFARRGATTVGVEIRDAHLAKAEFARQAISLSNCTFRQSDVRSLPADIGRFDCVFCAGILYHLDFPDCVRFLRDIARLSDDLLIIDSHLAFDEITESVLPLSEMRIYEFEGQRYRGREIVEHPSGISDSEKAKVNVWASIDNDISVWLTEADVIAILDGEGFTLAERSFPNRSYEQSNPDRPTLTFKRREL
jgi:SAM-dependent methyltransferase